MAQLSERTEPAYAQPRRPARGLLATVLLAAARWHAFRRRLRTRQALLQLNDAQLADIGLNRAQALAEAERPFWSLWRD